MVMELSWAVTILAGGLAVLLLGFWTQTKEKGTLATVGSVFLPVGLVIALLGTLLIFVPAFFNG
jgi:hypothetical protein